ncbi:helix-turn-helix transcriptional regulator [Mesorhizobium sp. B2-3-14]|uniref:helix-turn-helix domain-containing protein n=1 Tax=unclassified Mesorhizobium TaxID=325217 RepID=UPI0011263D1C|nr:MULTISPECIES: helix-turn-helix transcriptional regulator [unclassified Mesorhizobium]MBZ9975887.1 helix-turn-helix transcriptional regulator [Mesorhizobium sp. BR-1-1-10]TPL70790.1 helix-turn-helix transcriptional regulator [Mesorhizobium sp. B2-3-15]TPL86528.1 helix-turn-helix transcriptional regulator [Mesorhizobium sp. B2-3-14]
MSIRQNLAANLRRLCKDHASVSAVCRELGINRTQFERYLQGQTVPNKATAKLICDYFRVDEAELYRDPGAPSPAAPGLPPISESLFTQMIRPPAPSIAGGTYFTYFSIPGRSDLLVRAITFVRREAELVTFRRVTGWSEHHRSTWARARGNHYGVAISRLNWIYFSGVNRRQTGEPSLISVQWAPISEPVLTGKAMLLTEAGPAFVSVIMRQDRSNIRPRHAIRMAHVVRLDDPSLDQLVVSLARDGLG